MLSTTGRSARIAALWKPQVPDRDYPMSTYEIRTASDGWTANLHPPSLSPAAGPKPPISHSSSSLALEREARCDAFRDAQHVRQVRPIPDGIVVEPFAVDDNVMLVGGIHLRGRTIAEAVLRAGTLSLLTTWGCMSSA